MSNCEQAALISKVYRETISVNSLNFGGLSQNLIGICPMCALFGICRKRDDSIRSIWRHRKCQPDFYSIFFANKLIRANETKFAISSFFLISAFAQKFSIASFKLRRNSGGYCFLQNLRRGCHTKVERVPHD